MARGFMEGSSKTTTNQGNANQSHGEMSPHTRRDRHCRETRKERGHQEEEEREPPCAAGGIANVCSHCEKQCEVSPKTKNRTII